jgi:hypothetical protein
VRLGSVSGRFSAFSYACRAPAVDVVLILTCTFKVAAAARRQARKMRLNAPNVIERSNLGALTRLQAPIMVTLDLASTRRNDEGDCDRAFTTEKALSDRKMA